MKCGREPGGNKAEELGICPAAAKNGRKGKNRGTNCGRICWRIAGTMCFGDVQGTYVNKLNDCVKCKFFAIVKEEEGPDFTIG